MLSMAAASALLPFLPLLPVRILVNNFLYDFSQLTIPTDNVDEATLRSLDAGICGCDSTLHVWRQRSMD
jgi:hypothetical protein